MFERKPYLCFYGDDFTGSTDALDALAAAGVNAVLLVDPTDVPMDALMDVQAVGLAGTGRAMRPKQMDEALPEIFRWMIGTGARVLHYKVCSTFDSSPTIGSIGRAMEIARREMDGGTIPIIVGSPSLGRYVSFGSLFARAGSDPSIYRLDRHPVMSRHPVTPMGEADLRRHLAQQTDLTAGLTTLVDIEAGRMPDPDGDADAILFDTVNYDHLNAIGEWLDSACRERPVFTIGSSAVEAALAPIIAPHRAESVSNTSEPRSGKPIAVVSGSCSPVTARQIDNAVEQGFVPIPVNAAWLADPEQAVATSDKAIAAAAVALQGGKSVVVFTAHGVPDAGCAPDGFEARISDGLGRILCGLVAWSDLKRMAVAGGDTSGIVTRALGVSLLKVVAAISPGAPLCKASRRSGASIELALKGGQMGTDDYFVRVRDC